jgi:hypothetical protein
MLTWLPVVSAVQQVLFPTVVLLNKGAVACAGYGALHSPTAVPKTNCLGREFGVVGSVLAGAGWPDWGDTTCH